jgi:hypothetical protein
MSQTPETPAGPFRTAEVRDALEQVLSAPPGWPRRIVRLEHRPSAYRTSSALEEIDVWLDGGEKLALLLKDLGRQALSEDVRRTKPAFLHEPRREAEVYRTVLAGRGLGTAFCHGAVIDPRAGRSWLFLERVTGRELYQVGEMALWRQAARWLAVFHTRLGPDAGRLAPAAHLLRHDPDYYRLWLERALTFAARPGRPPEARRGLQRLARRYDRVVGHLLDLPATVIHGEFYASNILVEESAAGVRVCPVDWETAAIGPGLVDLAALTAGAWTEDQRADLAHAYRTALAEEGARPPPLGALLGSVDYCRLHLAVQWLGWAADWSPPPGQQQDWLAEALGLADQLGL